MKVYMIGSVKPRFACGGVEGSIANISYFLIKNRHEVINLCYYPKKHEGEGEFGKIIALKEMKPPFVNKFVYGFRVARKLKKILAENPEGIVHGHVDNSFGYALIRRSDLPFIWTNQGTSLGSYQSNYRELEAICKHKGIVGKSVFYFMERYVKRLVFGFFRAIPEFISAKRADLIVTSSEFVKDELVNLYKIDGNKIEVIYNGVNMENFKPVGKSKARKMLGFDGKKTYAVWVGVQHMRKGLDIAIEAIKDLDNVELLVVGPLPEYLKNRKVKHIGASIGDQRILNIIYNAADFLLFPSRYEPFGIVILEAMATKTPVIISDKCGAAEIMKDGVEGIIVKGLDPSEYRRQIEKLIADKKLYRNLADNGAKLAKKYDWKTQSQEYLSFYQKLTKKL